MKVRKSATRRTPGAPNRPERSGEKKPSSCVYPFTNCEDCFSNLETPLTIKCSIRGSQRRQVCGLFAGLL